MSVYEQNLKEIDAEIDKLKKQAGKMLAWTIILNLIFFPIGIIALISWMGIKKRLTILEVEKRQIQREFYANKKV